jgi:acetyl-CoA C-acetyltransferase
VAEDEQPRKTARPEKIPTLKPAFRKDGTVTAANSSSISDGAAALSSPRQRPARPTGSPPARASSAMPPTRRRPASSPPPRSPRRESSSTGSAGASTDVDLWEVNEAFAVVPMAFMREMGLPRDR